ncbi:hypothetical protein MPSEU_000373700 [Mayamaea pseudoterrestris]|nr:hypothetical protein MPSEU_000373700 [Mayamaea pseudoterrestris]
MTREILQALEPPPRQAATNRFSQLLLEHGECILQDWAVLGFSSAVLMNSSLNEQSTARAASKDPNIQWAQQTQSTTSHLSDLHPNPTTSDTKQKESFSFFNMSGIHGRLHLCSKSLVFEPNEVTRAIVRLPFANMDAPPSIIDSAEAAVQCISQRHFIMKENNVIAPTALVKHAGAFKFVFQHSSPDTFCTMVEEVVYDAQRDDTTIMVARGSEAFFYAENLVDMRESVALTNIKASIKTPLLSQPVVLALTAERLYLQPTQGSTLVEQKTNPPPANNWLLRDVIATARRYNGLRDSAIQIYFQSGSSILIALERRHDREQVLLALPNVVCFTDRIFVERAFAEWQKGTLTNYQYLLALNSAAGRTFHDLGRYPVFPWVIQDYGCSTKKLNLQCAGTYRDLSKPVGALNQERLDYFKTRMKNMHDMGGKFLYGTHYSAPAYVLYYLVRSMPEHMLCLQNGKFDAADRMFFDVENTFNCVLSNHADVKELIPEFYGNNIDFLINARGLHLGATQKGQRVDDVRLPTWAKSAKDFLKKNRLALESDLCTTKLPHWIDLIFGSNSRGDAAAKADNLFHPISYFGPTELAAMKSEEERHSAELQACEFGCCPDQLFVNTHPQRKDDTSELNFISSDIGRASSKEDDKGREAWELLDVRGIGNAFIDEQASHNNMEAETKYMQGATISPAATISQISQGIGEQSLLPGAVMSVAPGGSSQVSSTFDQLSNTTANEWNMHMIERKHMHNDSVSGCVLELNNSVGSILVTSSHDGGLKVHQITVSDESEDDGERMVLPPAFGRFSYSAILNRGKVASRIIIQSKLSEFRSHTSRDPLASLALANDGGGGMIAFAGGHDDVVLAYGVTSACAVATVYSHRDAVTGLDLICRTPLDLESALWRKDSTHILISGSWDAAVKVWSVNVTKSEAVSIDREPLAELFDAQSSVVCVSAAGVAYSNGCIVIAAGCVDSSFCAWFVHGDGMQVAIHNETTKLHGSGPCSVVRWITVNGALHLLVAFSTGKVASYSMAGERLKRDSAVSVGVAVSSLAYCSDQRVVLLGCSDGGLRLIGLRDGAHFDSRPTLWTKVNNKTAPGITSMSVVNVGVADPRKCLCCTGGADGSIALFELQRATMS